MAVGPRLDASESIPDERPQRRREWLGIVPSLVLPVCLIALIAGMFWYLAGNNTGGSVASAEQVDANYLQPANSSGPGVQPGDAAPNFRLTALDGREITLSDLRGQPVLINFWATWCGPCREEMPQLVDAMSRGSHVQIVAVDLGENRPDVQAFASDFGLPFPVLLDYHSEAARRYRVSGAPNSVLVGADGRVQQVFRGPLTQEQVRQVFGLGGG